MDRRTLLKLMAAGAALGACAAEQGEAGQQHVAVVGGGIIGASIAYHLSLEGQRVTLLERSGLATRASRGTFAWVNATWAKQPRHYHQFSQAGVAGWQQLETDLSLPIRWGGSLEWFEGAERQERLRQQIAEQAAWGEPARMVAGAELGQLEPNVNFRGGPDVAFSPNDGALDPVLATRLFADHARLRGAKIQTGTDVKSCQAMPDGQLRLQTDHGSIYADRVVLATGADPEAVQRLADIDLPQRSRPGVIVVTRPHPRLIQRIIVAPGVHIHQRPDGRLVLGEQDGPPDTAAHRARLAGRPTHFPEPSQAQEHAQRILANAAPFIPGIDAAEIEEVFIGWRPMPLDGHPVLGYSPSRPGVYLAIMHSGVSLAPVVGQVVAREIGLGVSSPLLDEYRPTRKFDLTRRY